MKRVFSLFLALLMCTTCCTTVFADDTVQRGPQYHYKSIPLESTETSARNLAAGQDRGGAYFSKTTRIHYSLSGGLSTTASVTVNLPKPYNCISFSVDIGRKASGVSEYCVGLEDGQSPGNYYLMITKYYDVDPYVVYRKRAGAADIDENWVIDHTGCQYEYRYHSACLITRSQAIAYGLLEDDE